jgi:flagellar basal-body rod protein FlgF
MDNSIYISLSRQMALFRDMEVTANNIANVDTPGYSAEKLLFSDYLVKDQNSKNAYANDPASYRDTSIGSMKQTGNPLDCAINGNAYFQVQTDLGTRYTRAGNFQLSTEGTLVTPQGYAVLGADGGQITIPQNAVNVVINGAGEVNADGEAIGQIGMMEFQDEQKLTRLGNTLYSASETPQPSETAHMAQGVLETSNVTAVTEMVRVMNVSRAVTNTSKFIEIAYDLERRSGQVFARQQA